MDAKSFPPKADLKLSEDSSRFHSSPCDHGGAYGARPARPPRSPLTLPLQSAQAAANAILKSNIVVPTAKAKVPRAGVRVLPLSTACPDAAADSPLQDGAENGASGANGSRPPIAKRKAIDDAAGLAGAKRKPQETTLLKKPAARAVPATGPASRPGAAAAAPAKKAAAKVSVPTVTAASGAPKRPAWDMKGRLEDMEADYRQMQARMCETTATLSAISAQLAEKNMSVQQLNESKTAVIGARSPPRHILSIATFRDLATPHETRTLFCPPVEARCVHDADRSARSATGGAPARDGERGV